MNKKPPRVAVSAKGKVTCGGLDLSSKDKIHGNDVDKSMRVIVVNLNVSSGIGGLFDFSK